MLTFNSRNHDHQFNMKGDASVGVYSSYPMGLGAIADGPKIPVKVWGTRDGVNAQRGAMEQAYNLANHPLAACFVALMPDFHPGYGMPIGGVFASKGGVIPNAVGNDIGCGMMAFETDIEADSISKETLALIRAEIHRRVPVGDGRHKKEQDSDIYRDTWDDVSAEGWGGMAKYPVVFENFSRSRFQMGTLGGGNHFIELDRDRESGKLWIMLHSGSRGIGAQILAYHHKKAKELNARWHSDLPTDELAFFPDGIPEKDCYIREMRWAMRWAEENRHEMMSEVQIALQECGIEVPMGVDVRAEREIETHHNYAKMERHFGADYLIHRKGAVHADVGERVIIPGSMGTASYICEGLGNKMSFTSCSHGAGRLRSRTDTKKLYTLERAQEEMKDVVFGVRDGEYDEMPGAYKDIHEVIQLESDLVRPLNVLEPIMVVKG